MSTTGHVLRQGPGSMQEVGHSQWETVRRILPSLGKRLGQNDAERGKYTAVLSIADHVDKAVACLQPQLPQPQLSVGIRRLQVSIRRLLSQTSDF
jgi:hypothetical protein